MPPDSGKIDRIQVNRFLRRKGLTAVVDKSRAEHLLSFKLLPEVIFDIGVDQGTPFLYQAFPEARFALVDPRHESAAALTATDAPGDAEFFETALGATPGTMTLTIPHSERGEEGAMASLRTRIDRLASKFIKLETRQVPVTTLDRLAAKMQGRIGLKIDTEGFEDEVLKGAVETLKRTDFVILELSLVQRFDGITPPSQIISRLAAAGLEFRDVLRMTGDGKGGSAPRLMDVLFTRWPTPAPTISTI
ncbi:methyltransferase, FkbM family [Pseudorhodobacter antarcticus]|jgi:FkbM family methyltransferase|uniref:Methyltransferase, FkbM family n=1 Tax=Pseudorhodobacter antarcticus TaxID=1077947 RepID=A0A1H8JG77_9RHOB|nr:FkbM family methyltransferase [Pseudorhodobacter antarcticus]SEN79306.1 methyltransferase, FkbM family [Pseudorhodobacter antarcticus]